MFFVFSLNVKNKKNLVLVQKQKDISIMKFFGI